jgi:hypothetical protein
MQGQRKQHKPDVGIGYKSTYKDKSGQEQGYLSVMLREEQLSQLEVVNGIIRLSIFPNLGEKKNEKAPDFVVKPALSKKTNATANASVQGRANVATATTAGSKFPF